MFNILLSRLTLTYRQRMRTSYLMYVLSKMSPNPKAPQYWMDAVMAVRRQSIVVDRFHWLQCDQKYESPKIKNPVSNKKSHRTILSNITLYEALLMLTLRPRLVNVHFRRISMSRCILSCSSFSLLPRRPVKISRNSSWSHWWLYSQTCCPIMSILKEIQYNKAI